MNSQKLNPNSNQEVKQHKDKSVYKCEKCEKEYVLHSRFVKHQCKVLSKRREDVVQDIYECSTCHKVYTRESALIKHICPVTAKQQLVKSPLGQAAYLFFATWQRFNRRVIPDMSTFAKSKYFVSFINFAKFNKSVKLPAVELYINIMNDKNITPELWCHNRAYGIYLEHMEHTADPLLCITITGNTLKDLALEYGCAIGEVFNKVSKEELTQLVRERKLSPWILLKSAKFGAIVKSMNERQLTEFENVVDYDFWQTKFNKDPKMQNFAKLCAREMEL